MKKIITLFAAALMALAPAAANNNPETVKKETKTFQVASFEGLEVSWIFQVELSQASQQKVVVEAPDFLMPYLKVKVRDNKLILGVDNLPGNIRRRVEKENHTVRAIVAMPELSDLEMSGASKVVATGDFQTTHFEMELPEMPT